MHVYACICVCACVYVCVGGRVSAGSSGVTLTILARAWDLVSVTVGHSGALAEGAGQCRAGVSATDKHGPDCSSRRGVGCGFQVNSR